MAPTAVLHSGDSDNLGPTQTTDAPNVQVWSEKDRQQQLLHFKPPAFTIPYPVGINSYAAEATKETQDWLLEQGIDKVFSPKVFAEFLQSKFPELPSRAFPDHDPQFLRWACKFFTWLWVLDDQMDDTALGMKRGSAVPVFIELHLLLLWNFPNDPVLHENLNRFLDAFPNSELRVENRELINNTVRRARTFPVDTVYDGELEPTANAFRDLWTSCVRTMPHDFSLRLAQVIQKYFIGNLEETANRENNIIPSLDVYIPLRRKTGGVEPTIIITDLFDEKYVPNDLFNSPPMQRLMTAMIDVLCWHNDMWSFKKEMGRDDVHNLVTLISLERKHLTYDECALVVQKMIYDRVADFEEAAADLLAICPSDYEDVVRRYIKTCQYYYSGSQAWHSGTARYQ